jgi:hypothetical protein
MGEIDHPEPRIYQLRAVLRGIGPLIWRRLLVRSDSTVAQLHEALQVAFGWDDEHLNRLEIRGREYAVYRDGGGLIGIDATGMRLGQFGLTLHPDKTRLLEFGRFATENRRRRGLAKPETFNFLGFTHICERSREGRFQLMRKTRADRMRSRLRAIKAELRRRMHMPIGGHGRWLAQVVQGYFAYHAVSTNSRSLSAFRYHVADLWRRTLRRRGKRDRSTWQRMAPLVADFLPLPRMLHPWPTARFAVNYPRWKPDA